MSNKENKFENWMNNIFAPLAVNFVITLNAAVLCTIITGIIFGK